MTLREFLTYLLKMKLKKMMSQTQFYTRHRRNLPNMKLMKKYTLNQNLKLSKKQKKKTVKKEDNFKKSVIDENKVDIQILKDAELKKIQDVFDEVKDEPKTVEPDVFLIDDTDIFDQENVSEKDRKFIMDLTDRTTSIADAKKYLEKRDLEMEIPNDKQRLKKEEILVNKAEKMPHASIENKIMKKAKIENEFEKEIRKNKRK